MDLRPPDPPEGGWSKRLAVGTASLFGAIILLVVVDLIADLSDGTSIGHVVFEGLVAVVGAIGLVIVLRHLTHLRRQSAALRHEARDLEARLAATAAEAERWRVEAAELLAGLGAALATQFQRWGLSPAEQEVALLLLKGLSHKEIADTRGVSEATTRQQARALYRKAGVAGRNELASFFLEDLLLPTRRKSE